MSNEILRTCFYEGVVHHRRTHPIRHEFHYRLFMVYIDLAEAEKLFSSRGLWSSRWPAVAKFNRKDFLGNSTESLEESVRELVSQRLGWLPKGPIRLLTNLRYCGFQFNPISLYYCFNECDSELEAVVAEVSNTPWNERHYYVHDLRDENELNHAGHYNARTPKEFHVSPFMEMAMDYRWKIGEPAEQLFVRLENIIGDEKIFDATLTLRKKPFSRFNKIRLPLMYPLSTLRTFAQIYWQAFRLWLKGVPYVPHPKSSYRQLSSSAVSPHADEQFTHRLDNENISEGEVVHGSK